MRIAGIGIDLIIPASAGPENAAVIINGYLSMKEEEYLGSIKIKLPKANIAGGATMRMKPKMPAWAIDAFLEMSVPIPLGPSGLGIYGFRGLFGYRYIATKEAAGLTQEDDWFDYYKVDMPPDGKGLHLGKMQTPDETSGAKTPHFNRGWIESGNGDGSRQDVFLASLFTHFASRAYSYSRQSQYFR